MKGGRRGRYVSEAFLMNGVRAGIIFKWLIHNGLSGLIPPFDGGFSYTSF